MGKKIIFCNCKGDTAETQGLNHIFLYLQSIPVELFNFYDLCGVCAIKKNETRDLFLTSDEFLVIACYSRTVKLLLRNIGIDPDSGQFSFLNVKEIRGDALMNRIQAFYQDGFSGKSLTTIESDPEWPSWYPLVDYSRCSSCGQCADFCLFSVYEKREGKISVVNPTNCKNNCPACARLCPQIAIVFPKYSGGGAIGGSETVDEMEEEQRQRKDMDSILGSDIYKTLELRKAKRKSIIKGQAMNKALEEREKALNEKNNK